jgi:hypothetical protein
MHMKRKHTQTNENRKKSILLVQRVLYLKYRIPTILFCSESHLYEERRKRRSNEEKNDRKKEVMKREMKEKKEG